MQGDLDSTLNGESNGLSFSDAFADDGEVLKAQAQPGAAWIVHRPLLQAV